jgi:hypothetical protein
VRAPGQELFSAPAAAYLLNLIEGTQFWVDNMAIRSDPASMERIRNMLADARSRMLERIWRHGRP